MTVAELIAELQKLPQDADVFKTVWYGEGDHAYTERETPRPELQEDGKVEI